MGGTLNKEDTGLQLLKQRELGVTLKRIRKKRISSIISPFILTFQKFPQLLIGFGVSIS